MYLIQTGFGLLPVANATGQKPCPYKLFNGCFTLLIGSRNYIEKVIAIMRMQVLSLAKKSLKAIAFPRPLLHYRFARPKLLTANSALSTWSPEKKRA